METTGVHPQKRRRHGKGQALAGSSHTFDEGRAIANEKDRRGCQGKDQVCGIFRVKPAAAALRAGLQFYILSYAATIMRLPAQWQRIFAPYRSFSSEILRIGATRITPSGVSFCARPYSAGRRNSPCTAPRAAASRRPGSSGCSRSLRASGTSKLRRQPLGTLRERNSQSVLRTWK